MGYKWHKGFFPKAAYSCTLVFFRQLGLLLFTCLCKNGTSFLPTIDAIDDRWSWYGHGALNVRDATCVTIELYTTLRSVFSNVCQGYSWFYYKRWRKTVFFSTSSKKNPKIDITVTISSSRLFSSWFICSKCLCECIEVKNLTINREKLIDLLTNTAKDRFILSNNYQPHKAANKFRLSVNYFGKTINPESSVKSTLPLVKVRLKKNYKTGGVWRHNCTLKQHHWNLYFGKPHCGSC